MKERTAAILAAANLIASGREEFTCCAIDQAVGVISAGSPARLWYERWFKPARTHQYAWLNLWDDARLTYEEQEISCRERRLTFLAMAAAVSETEE